MAVHSFIKAQKVPDKELGLVVPEDEQEELARDASSFMSTVFTFRDRSMTAAGQPPDVAHPAPDGSGPAVVSAGLKQVIRVTLEWRDLNYHVVVGHRRQRRSKAILQGLSATVQPGRLVAVMGPSGCGKTSLINALAGRLPVGGTLDGEVLVNGAPRGRGFFSVAAYVMQDDVLFPNLTVKETLDFAADMRLPASVPAAAKAARVAEVIAELGLAEAQNTYIGSAFVRGVSGGERKRVNVGVELLANPSLLFLDEPTSGLDAFQAQNVMDSLHSLAQQGRSVVATIHQPRSSIFKRFDLLQLLSEGRAVYFGPAEEAVPWFAGRGYTCPDKYNPADFFLDVISVDHRSPGAEEVSRRRVQLLAEQFRRQQAAEAAEEGGQPAAVSAADAAAMQAVNKRPAFPNRVPVEFGLLLQRAWKQQSRDRLPMIITLAQTVICGFVLAALFSNIPKDQTGIQDQTGLLFFTGVFTIMTALFAALNTFPQEAGVINRERASRSYHVLPYFLARFICDTPLRVGQGLLFGTIVYWITGLNPSAAAFFRYVALLILLALASQGLGVAVSAAVKTEKLAFAVAPGITIILILFGGFLVQKDSIPAAIRWIEWLSHLYWAFMGLTINNFRGRTGWSCNNGMPDCAITGDQVIARLGFGSNEMWQPYVALCVLVLLYNSLGYLVLRISKPRFLPLTPAPAKKGSQQQGPPSWGLPGCCGRWRRPGGTGAGKPPAAAELV